MSDDELQYDEEDVEEEEDEDEELASDNNDQDNNASDNDQDPLIDDNSAAYKPIKLTRSRSFEVLDKSELSKESDKLISEVTDVLGISRPAAAILLRHMKWNKEALIEKYMENSDAFCIEAGIPQLALERPPDKPTQKYTCLICTEEYPVSQTYALACGHRYCNDCWKTYLSVKLIAGRDCISARCPAPKCKAKVHEVTYKKLVDPEMFEQYANYVLRSYVDDNPLVKWCCAPGCTYTIRCERKDRKEAVTCKCGFQFCFTCCDYDIGDHMPCPCAQIEMWLQKASDESENVTWMLANTKKCPMCRAPIEKNGGCMHMSCKKNSGGCGYEFCWLCRGPWTEHGSATGGFYNCNKYDKSKAKEEDVKATDAKTELEAYMFYYHRYESHRNAMRIADEQRKNATKKELDILTKFEVRSADTKFLPEATEQLIRNRRVLQYSYAYGFYLDKKSQERNLFEYLQEDLEKHTNYLSTLYETPVDKLASYQDFIQWKEQVTNYTRITNKFLDNFVEGVAGGLTH